MVDETRVDPNILLTDENGEPLARGTNQNVVEPIDTILDRNWVRNTFVVSDVNLTDNLDRVNRYWSTVESKFTDSSPGGDIGINPRPQFTQYADIHSTGIKNGRSNASVTNTTGNIGRGRYNSEAVDDNAERLYLQFGLPQFNSLARFAGKAFDPEAAKLANTGKRMTVAKTIISIIGTALLIRKLPVLVSFYWGAKLLPFLPEDSVYWKAKSVLNNIPEASNKYYTMNPTMYLYLTAVTGLYNTVCVEYGLMPESLQTNERSSQGDNVGIDTTMLEALRTILPDIFTENDYIDLYAIINRAQRMSNNRLDRDIVELMNGKVDYVGYVERMQTEKVSDSNKPSFLDYVKRKAEVLGFYTNSLEEEETTISGKTSKDPFVPDDYDPDTGESSFKNENGVLNYAKKFYESYKADRDDGSSFAIFIVDHVESVTESFSTTVTDAPVADVINNTSQASRSFIYNMAGGNIGNNVIADSIESIAATVKDTATVALSSVTFGLSNILTGLMGGGFIEVPKIWSGSDITLPQINYTIKLISPYGHPLAHLLHIQPTLMMLLGGILPLSTGKASHTAPFLCRSWHPGKQIVSLGMMNSLSITRGTSDLSFGQDNRALAYDVSFSIVDLSTVMSMPVSLGGIWGSADVIEEDSILSNYLKVLGGRDVNDMYYLGEISRFKTAKEMFAKDQFRSAAGNALWFNDTSIGRTMQAFGKEASILRVLNR